MSVSGSLVVPNNTLVDRRPSQLVSGKEGELKILADRGITDHKQTLFRPSDADINSPLFKEIVGEPKFTKTGLPKGTFPDFEDAFSIEEIKLGSSVLRDSHQIRLQLFKAQRDQKQFILTTTRPIDSKLSELLQNNNAIIQKPK